MSCGPCKETADCIEIVDDEENDAEYQALTDLFNRLFESKRTAADCRPAEDRASRDETPARHETPTRHETRARDKPPARDERPPAEHCVTPASDGSPMKRADRLLTALLRRQPTRADVDGDSTDPAAEGDVTHLTASLPAFRSCRDRRPGTVNAELFGLDLEQQIGGAGTAGDGRDDDVKRAAYDLAAAEARCKHAGAVEAAELAVHVEPAGHLAEMAARFGARSHASDGRAGSGTGQAAGGDSPVVVVAYVGNTGPAADV